MDRVKEEPIDSQYADGESSRTISAPVVACGTTTPNDAAQEGVRQNSLQRIQQRKIKVFFLLKYIFTHNYYL